MKKKSLIFVGAIIALIIIIILTYIFTKDSNLINKTKVVSGIQFSDAKINIDDKCLFTVTVTTTENELKVEDFDAIIYDKKGEKLEILTGYIGDIDKNSKKEITIPCNEDLSKAYEINYTLRLNND